MMWQIRWLNRSIATIIATLHLIYIYIYRERERERERERLKRLLMRLQLKNH